MASYQDPGGTAPVTVGSDSTAEFNGEGGFTAHACNYISGSVTITGAHLDVSPGSSTAMACSGEPGELERQVEATMKGSVTFRIAGRFLTLTNADGHVLTYRVRASIYPGPTATTILVGDRAGGQFRLAVSGSGDHLGMEFQARTAPGQPWGESGIASPGPKDCLADEVMGAGGLGGQTFLAAWVTPDVAKVTTQATTSSPPTTLEFYSVPGSTLRIAGLWTDSFSPSTSPVTFYDAQGGVIAAYPHGPC